MLPSKGTVDGSIRYVSSANRGVSEQKVRTRPKLLALVGLTLRSSFSWLLQPRLMPVHCIRPVSVLTLVFGIQM